MTGALVLGACSGHDARVEPTTASGSAPSASETVPPYLKAPQPPGDLFDVGGHRMHLYCTGEGDRTVLLDAGLGDWSLNLRPLQEELDGMTRVCSYDRSGYGWSEPGPAPRTGERIVGELQALLEAADEPGPYVLVGHSFGGLSMLMFAEAHPETVAGVVLIDSSHPRQDQAAATIPALVAAQQADLANRRAIAVRAEAGLVGAVDVLPLAPKFLPLELKYQWAALAARPHSLRTSLAEDDAWAETTTQVGGRGSLGDIPLVVLAAGLGTATSEPGLNLSPREFERVDAIWRSLQTDHLARSTNARLVVAEHSGHYIHATEPELVVAAVRDLTAT